jgi:hypothetical protein
VRPWSTWPAHRRRARRQGRSGARPSRSGGPCRARWRGREGGAGSRTDRRVRGAERGAYRGQ